MKPISTTSEPTTNYKGINFCNPDYDKESERVNEEDNDCVVKALAAVFGIEYNVAHQFAKHHMQRKDCDGVRGWYSELDRYDEKLFDQKVTNLGRLKGRYTSVKTMFTEYQQKGETKYRAVTVGAFLKLYPKGRYYILVRGHALAIINGAIYGNYTDSTRLKTRIESAYLIGEVPVIEEEDVEIEEGEKVCSGCGESKPYEEYHKNKRSKDGRGPKCRECYRIWDSPAEREKRRLKREIKE